MWLNDGTLQISFLNFILLNIIYLRYSVTVVTFFFFKLSEAPHKKSS